MAVLSTPHPFNQDAPGTPNGQSDCGECCVASVLYDNGDTGITIANVLALIGHSGDTDQTDLVQALQKKGVGAHAASGNVGTYVGLSLSSSRRAFALIWSDHHGYPTPGSGIGHWVEVYGLDTAGYHCMNPVGGVLVTYPRAVLEPASQNAGVQVDLVLPADNVGGGADLLMVI